ncbi:MAG: alpha/beta fold hydrolase [Pseudomonadota bacterium]
MTGPNSRYFLSAGRKLHAVTWGDVAAPPVVLVHGLKDMARAWDGIATRLADDFFVVAPDLAGHGDSPWSADRAYTMSSYVYDLASLVRDLERDGHTGPVLLVGHSLGGNIALRYAAAEPERVSRLCAIEGIGPTPDKAAETDAQPVEERMRAWMDKRRTLLERTPRAIMTSAWRPCCSHVPTHILRQHGPITWPSTRRVARTMARSFGSTIHWSQR